MPDYEYLIYESFNTAVVSIGLVKNIFELSGIRIFSFANIDNNKQKLCRSHN